MSNSRAQPVDNNPLGTPVKTIQEQTIFINPDIKKDTKRCDGPFGAINAMEPDFVDTKGACHMSYWADIIAQMADDIRERQLAASHSEFDFFKPRLVEYIFTVCVRLRLPNEVRFTAMLILNSFLYRSLCSMHEFMDRQELEVQKKNKEWENLESNMERQIPLRVMTAIQISSKIHSYHDSLSSRQIVNTLRKVGLPYTLAAVAESELRVFKAIEFRIPSSPFDACEMALKSLTYTMKKRKMGGEERQNDIWQHILVILDVCFINHTELYERFVRKCPQVLNAGMEKRLIISKFKCDMLLLASAIVQTAFALCIGKEKANEISSIVNKILGCDKALVNPMRHAIYDLADSKKRVEFSEEDNS